MCLLDVIALTAFSITLKNSEQQYNLQKKKNEKV